MNHEQKKALTTLAYHCHDENRRWWYSPTGEKLVRNKGEMIALMHSELSEMLEGIRKNKMDEHLPHLTSESVELADLLIRALDYAAAHSIDVATAMAEKLEYNRSREDHTYEARSKSDGKKF